MISGGVCVLDEGNRMNEKSWASLAPAAGPPAIRREHRGRHHDPRPCRFSRLRDDERGRIDLRGARLHPLAAAADPEPGLSQPRRRAGDPQVPPAVRRGRPAGPDRRVPAAGARLKLDFSPRDGINLLRFAIKRMAQDPAHPLGRDAAWREALFCVLGEEAADLEEPCPPQTPRDGRPARAAGPGRPVLQPRRIRFTRMPRANCSRTKTPTIFESAQDEQTAHGRLLAQTEFALTITSGFACSPGR